MPRLLKCPKCGQMNTIADGAKPSCAHCGFGTQAAKGALAAPASSQSRPQPTAPQQAFAPNFARPLPTSKPATKAPPSAIAAAALFGLALVVVVLLQVPFAHWSSGTFSSNSPAATATPQYNTWGIEDGVPASAGATAPSGSYWASGSDAADGIWLLRAGGPLLLVAAALAVVAAVAVVIGKRNLANNCGWAAASVGATAVVLTAIGVTQHEAQVRAQAEAAANASSATVALVYSWDLALWLGVAAVAILVVGTFLAAMRTKAPAPTGTAPQRPLA